MTNVKLNQSYVRIAIMVLLINVVFASAAQYYGLSRAWINIDYLLLSLLFFYKNKTVSIILFFVLFLFIFVDFMLLGLQIFPFIQIGDLLYFSSFIFNSPPLYRIMLLLALVLIVFLFYFIKNFVADKVIYGKGDFIKIVGVLFPLFLLSSWSNPIITSQTFFAIKNSNLSVVELTGKNPMAELTTDFATKTLLNDIQTNQLNSNRILLIISESWNETATPEQQQAILKPLLDKKGNFEFIHQGSFFAMGATVTGEVRELCQKKLLLMDTNKISANEFKHCIPNLLKQKGYATYSIYGGDDILYSPNYWYPLAGLDTRYFVQDLPEGGECKMFNGRCDVKLTSKVKELILSSDKSFVYWLTLNSHAPYDDYVFIEGFDCEKVGLKDGSAVCGNYKLHYQFFVALSQMLDDRRLGGLEVYVVGDHPAPVANIKEGLLAFKNSEVAWLHFKLK